ncbi:MAG: hypothetical protein ACI837_001745 [Crocinitomicaceae bacterium]|jgi:hypothetical protein
MAITIKKKGLARLISFCFVGLTLGAFGQGETFYDLKEVQGLYSVEIPDFMESSAELNDQASLQYSNLYEEKYIIVIDENKQEFIDVFTELELYDSEKSVIDNYAEQQYEIISDEAEIDHQSMLVSLVVNDLPMRRKNFDAKVDGILEDISYFFAFVEGEESLYTIMAWTLGSKKSEFIDEVDVIMTSFQELGGPRTDEPEEEELSEAEMGDEEFAELLERMEEAEDELEHDYVLTPSADRKSLNVQVNSLYEIVVPSFMESSTTLNEEASLQYNNLDKEKYVIVIDEDKQEFIDVFKELELYDDKKSIIDNYAIQQAEFMSGGSDIKFKTKMEKMKFNGLTARGINFDANVQGVDETVSYFFGFAEGEETLYMIMAWTLESVKSTYEKEAEEIIKSFKEL